VVYYLINERIGCLPVHLLVFNFYSEYLIYMPHWEVTHYSTNSYGNLNGHYMNTTSRMNDRLLRLAHSFSRGYGDQETPGKAMQVL